MTLPFGPPKNRTFSTRSLCCCSFQSRHFLLCLLLACVNDACKSDINKDLGRLRESISVWAKVQTPHKALNLIGVTPIKIPHHPQL